MNQDNLHNYQHTAVSHIILNYFCALFLDMGLGKTVSTLTAIYKLIFEELEVDRVFIIAPKRVAESVWDAEIEKWDHLKDLKISKVIGNEKKRKAALAEKAHIYIIGRDNVVWLCGQYGGSMLPGDMLVIDESSSFKNPKALRFKALKLVQASFKRIVLLTGTPAPNGLIDIWSQIWLLDRGERLGKTVTSYKDNYFKPDKQNGAIVYSYKLQAGCEEAIHDKIKDICLSMKAKDYLNLPPRIDNYIDIVFPEDLQAKYDDFEKEMVLDMFGDNNEISAVNAAALRNKLLQFSNGAVYDAEKNYHIIHDLKLDALEEIVENANGKPVLVAYAYKHDCERILQRLKKYKAKKLDTDKDILDWNKKQIPVMVMHPASGGHGLNLQAGGNIIVWFGLTDSLELYQQFTARLDRQGQLEPVIAHHLIINKTMESEVKKGLIRKDLTQESLMRATKARIDKYLK